MKQSQSGTVVCPICNVGSLQKSYRASPLDYSDNYDYQIRICSQCSYGKTDNIQQQLIGSSYIGGCYDLKEKTWHKLIRPLLLTLERGKLNYLKNNKNIGNKLLEIGCGKGRFLEAAQKKGFSVFGIEPSSRSFAFASERLGDVVASVGLEEIDNVSTFPKRFDYVILWHVLEHLNNPIVVLSKVKKILDIDGRVVIAVPNFASFQAQLGKAEWYHLDPPRHLHHFTPQSLRNVILSTGFEVENFFFNSLYQNFVGDIITIVNKILPGNNVVFNGLRINHAYLDHFGTWGAWALFALGLAISLIISPLVFLFTVYSQLIGRSGTMVVVIKPAYDEN